MDAIQAGVSGAAGAPLTVEELTSAVELLNGLIPAEEMADYSLAESPGTVYSTLVTLWMLTLQRLGGGQSMVAVVKEILSGSRHWLPDHKRVREGTLSENSGAYSRARSRLPLAVARDFAERVSRSLIEQSPSWFGSRRAFLLDGTTITLSPTSSLRAAYPPATNQHGETVWPVLMLMVAHELQSGCALVPELGAMYGDENTSEARLAAAMAGRIPRGSLVLADANFGIFRVAWAMVGAGHDVLFRLTKSRFQALRRSAVEIDRTETSRHHKLTWTPSVKDRQTHPDLPADATLEVDLHETTLDNGEPLYLVTTLRVPTAVTVESYSYRYDVEHDLRDLKVTLGIETLRARTDAMVQKELLCSIVAYNLVMQLRREAAQRVQVPPRRLSFTGVWTTMQIYLLHQPPCSAATWLVRYEQALRSASRAKLPNRPGRSHPRKALPRRQKSTKFMTKPTINPDVGPKEKPK